MTSGPDDETPERKAGAVLTLIGSVIAPVTFITALLYYFAWIRESAVFGYFGVDQSVIGFSNTDYLLRSAGVAFRPFSALIVLAALVLGAYAFAGRLVMDRPAKVRLVFVLTFVSVGAFLALFGLGVIFGYVSVPEAAIRAPIALGVGVALVESGASLADGMWRSGDSERQRLRADRTNGTSFAKATVFGRRTLAGMLILIAVFWAITLYAQESGNNVAHRVENTASDTSIVLYSQRDLHIDGQGVTVHKFTASTDFPFRYCGLRLLIHGTGRWLLIPDLYSHADADGVIVVPDDSTTRIDFIPPGVHAKVPYECK